MMHSTSISPLLDAEAAVLESLHGTPVVGLQRDEELHEVDERHVEADRGEPEEEQPVIFAELTHVGQHVVKVNAI